MNPPQIVLLFAAILGFWYEVHKVLQVTAILVRYGEVGIEKVLLGWFFTITFIQVGFVLSCTGVYV